MSEIVPNAPDPQAGQAIIPTAADKPSNGIQTTNVDLGFNNSAGFELVQRVAKAFSQSTLVPTNYQGNMPNCIVAINMAQRLGADPLMVMQNLYIVHGRPAWSSQFLISCFNQCGRFSAMRFDWRGEKGSKDWGCRAYAIEKETGDRLDGSWVTWEMAEAEGWSKRNGSKWLTMPQQMFIYRAASFFTRAYAPELTMGLQTQDEVRDVIDVEAVTRDPQKQDDPPVSLSDLKPVDTTGKAAPKAKRRKTTPNVTTEQAADLEPVQTQTTDDAPTDPPFEPDPEPEQDAAEDAERVAAAKAKRSMVAKVVGRLKNKSEDSDERTILRFYLEGAGVNKIPELPVTDEINKDMGVELSISALLKELQGLKEGGA